MTGHGLIGVVLTGTMLVSCGPSSPDGQAGPANMTNSVSAPIASKPGAAEAKGQPDNGAVSVAKAQPAAQASASASAPAPRRRVADAASTYRAIGTEPFWAVTVRDARATLERPGKPQARFLVERSDDARAIRYQGEGFAMTLDEGPCSDGMSDALWSDRVQIAFGEGTLKGCGGLRQDRRKDAP